MNLGTRCTVGRVAVPRVAMLASEGARGTPGRVPVPQMRCGEA